MKLCELRYGNQGFSNWEDEDILLVYRGNVYPIHVHDTSDSNVAYCEGILKTLCRQFPDYERKILDDNGKLRSFVARGSHLDDAFWNFMDCPKVLVGVVEDNYNGLMLDFMSENYDVRNSKELNALLQGHALDEFDGILVNGKEIDVNREAPSRNEIGNVPLANPVYHGTTVESIGKIFCKGLRGDSKTSNWGKLKNDGYVFMAADFKTAEAFADNAANAERDRMAILEINTDFINPDNIVLDYDFTNTFSSDIEDSPYENSKLAGMTFYRGDAVSNKRSYGTKFDKFGYKGTVMPKAITGVYVANGAYDWDYYTKEQWLSVTEARGESLAHAIPMYYGGSVKEINESLGQSTTAFRDGVKLSSDPNDFNGCDVVIEVKVPTKDIAEWKVSPDNDGKYSLNETVDLCRYRLKVNRIGEMGLDSFGKLMESNGGDAFSFVGELPKVCESFGGKASVDDPLVWVLLQETLGERGMEEQGLLEKRVNEVAAKDISLDSFKVKDELNPKFWVDGKLNSRVRLRLLDIADDFIEEMGIGWVKPEDIVLTGSIANYNWSRYSDVDIHIMMDYSKIYKRKDFVKDFFDAKKEVWGNTHDNLKIYGFPVEIYVEDIHADNQSSGIYSLEQNKWVKEPDDFQDARINASYVKREAAKLMTDIDSVARKLAREKDEHRFEKLSGRMTRIFDRLKKLRKEGLSSASHEMSSGNIIWKILRRSGYLDKIWDTLNGSYDRINSLK